MSYIICKDVAFAYENQIVVSGLSFQVDAGDYLCIIGENGTGKTTLMKGLLGLKKPYRGTIVTGDGLKSAEIGYVPQQDAVQRDFPASVYEVVLSGCLNSRGMKPGFGAEEKKRALGNMELLCATKRLLLLDEPVTGLDPVAAEEFYGVLDALNGKHGITVIMISHDIREAVEHADHILHLSHGGYYFGTTQDYEKSSLGKKFLGGLTDA